MIRQIEIEELKRVLPAIQNSVKLRKESVGRGRAESMAGEDTRLR
jgi:hypothetical protein